MSSSPYSCSNASTSTASSSSSPSSSSSSLPSPTATKMAPNTSSDPKVVIRCGFVIPQIRLTPPDDRPVKSPEVPEQDLGANRLYVPLRTEEVGWEEGGLIWAPKRFCYPTVNLYGGADDRIIGTYRGGPEGYRMINITDPAFSLAKQDGDEATTSTTSSKTRGSKSHMPKGPAKVTANAPAATPAPPPSTPTTDSPKCLSDEEEDVEMEQSSDEAAYSAPSSASSSRQSSFSSSTDDGRSSGADTGMTTPTHDDDAPAAKPADGATLTTQLDAALTELLTKCDDEDTQSSGSRKLASRTGAGSIPCETVDAARLGGPFKQQLNNNVLGHDRSLTLADQVPAEHFTAARGRSTAKLSVLDGCYVSDETAGEFAGGWAYEQNMQTQHQLEGDNTA